MHHAIMFPYLDYSQRVQAAEALVERLTEAVHFMPSCEQKKILLKAIGAYWLSTGRHAWADHYFQHSDAIKVEAPAQDS